MSLRQEQPFVKDELVAWKVAEVCGSSDGTSYLKGLFSRHYYKPVGVREQARKSWGAAGFYALLTRKDAREYKKIADAYYPHYRHAILKVQLHEVTAKGMDGSFDQTFRMPVVVADAMTILKVVR